MIGIRAPISADRYRVIASVLYPSVFLSMRSYRARAQLVYVACVAAAYALSHAFASPVHLAIFLAVLADALLFTAFFAAAVRRRLRARAETATPRIPPDGIGADLSIRHVSAQGMRLSTITRWLDIGGDLYLVMNEKTPHVGGRLRRFLRPRCIFVRIDGGGSISDAERATLAKICAVVPRATVFVGAEPRFSPRMRRIFAGGALAVALLAAWQSRMLGEAGAIREGFLHSQRCAATAPVAFVRRYCAREPVVVLRALREASSLAPLDAIRVTLRSASGDVEDVRFPATPSNVAALTQGTVASREANAVRFGRRIVGIVFAGGGFATAHSPMDFEIAVDRAVLVCLLLGFGSILTVFAAEFSRAPLQRLLASPPPSPFASLRR